jgi:hypothetical protein
MQTADSTIDIRNAGTVAQQKAALDKIAPFGGGQNPRRPDAPLKRRAGTCHNAALGARHDEFA